MRFRKGSRVEVLSRKESLYGAWRSAEIISGNGHTYSVRYYSFGVSKDEALEERVPRKFIRPCPPKVHVDRWEAGELVEVLDNFFWKTAIVLEELPGRYYVVRLLGVSAAEEFTVHNVNLRARHSWKDEQWIMIGKVSCSLKSSTLTGSGVHQNLNSLWKSRVPEETSVASFRVLKRPSPCDWFESAESCTGSPKKRRPMEEEGDWNLFATSSVQKVDAAACLAEHNKSGYRQMVRVRSKRFSECDDTDACSVGSCSPIYYAESEMSTSFLDGSNEDANSCSSDAESSKEKFDFVEEPLPKHSMAGGEASRSSRPELYTYRSKLGKLFASGPLSWDQEASLTDVRLSLNISNDEHLMELRNLNSGVGCTSMQCGIINSHILFLFKMIHHIVIV